MKPDAQELALIHGIVAMFEEMSPEIRRQKLAWVLEAANGHPEKYTRRFNSMLYEHLKTADLILRGRERQIQIRNEINAPLPPVNWPSYRSVVVFFARLAALVGVLYAILSFFVGLASGLKAWAMGEGGAVVGIAVGALALGWLASALFSGGSSGGEGGETVTHEKFTEEEYYRKTEWEKKTFQN